MHEANFDREFIKWFYEEPYPDIGSNRATVMGTPENTLAKDYWMRQAYKQGLHDMWADIIYTLRDFACATAGLPKESVSPEEIYDRVLDNLHYYVSGVLK